MLDHHRHYPPACACAVRACGRHGLRADSPPLGESVTSSTVAGPGRVAAAGPALREAEENCSAALWAAIPLASSGFASPKITYVSLTGDL